MSSSIIITIIIFTQSLSAIILLCYSIANIDGKHGISENLVTGLFGASLGMLFTVLLFCKLIFTHLIDNNSLQGEFYSVSTIKILSSVVLIIYGFVVNSNVGSLILGIGVSIFVSVITYTIIYATLYRLQPKKDIEKLVIMNIWYLPLFWFFNKNQNNIYIW